MARTSTTWPVTGAKIDVKTTEPDNKNLGDYILSIREPDINFNLIMDLFGEFEGKSLCKPYDLIKVPVGAFEFVDFDNKIKSNTNAFTTTLGLYLFNQILSGFNFSKFMGGYVNTSIDKKMYGKIDSVLSSALIEDDITTEELKKWEDYMQWFMGFEAVLCANHTEKMLTCTKIISKKKAELVKQRKAELDAGSVKAAEDIEKELLDFAKEYLKDDPSMDMIDSGAGGKLENNFKNMYVMKGAVMDPDPTAKTPYRIVTSNYMDGIGVEDYAAIAGSGTYGAYSRGKKTELGGYWEKLFISAFQHLQLGPKDSDCGTKKHITVTLDNSNIDKYLYCYAIKSNGELELITSKNKSKFIGKKTNLRFASMCEWKNKNGGYGFCNKCVGELIYVSLSENVGVAMSQVPATLKLRCMKAFHDTTVSTSTFNPMQAFYPYQ